MARLVSNELLRTATIKKVTSNGEVYETFFRYTGVTREDSDVCEIGFIRNGFETRGEVYLPRVREDGFLERNHALWYPVHLVIPPLRFNGLYGSTTVNSLSGILNNSIFAKSLDDFLPQVKAGSLDYTTPVAKAMAGDPTDVNDMNNWLVIDLATALCEMFNIKILASIARSKTGGATGVNAAVRGMHALINAYTRYFSDDQEELAVEAHDRSEVEYFGKAMSEDKQGTVVVHPMVRNIKLNGDTPLDFCSCSQNTPMLTARFKDGIGVRFCRFTGSPTFPYARYRRGVVGILSDDPHRVIVSRSVTRAMVLREPMDPLVVTEVPMNVHSLCLPGVRMTHPFTFEDGIIVSETFARRAGAFKVYVDKITVPESAEITFSKIPYSGEDDDIAAVSAATMDARIAFDAGLDMEKSCCSRGETVAIVTYHDENEDMTIEKIQAGCRVRSCVMSIGEYEPVSDLDEKARRFKITYLAYLPLVVGSKLADAHGNKGTVSKILPDHDMPVSDGMTMHYIASPFVGKRLALGAEVEDLLAMKAFYGIHPQVTVDSGASWNIAGLESELASMGLSYRGMVAFEGREYPDVVRCFRAMYRLDNNPQEALTVRTDVVLNDRWRTSRNTKLSLEMVSMLSRGASNLVNELVERSGSRVMLTQSVMPILSALARRVPEGRQTIKLTRRIPRDLLGNPSSIDLLKYEVKGEEKVLRDFKDSALDPRMATSFGVVETPFGDVIVPPYKPFAKVGYGIYRVNPVAVAANRVIAEVVSYKSSNGFYNTDIEKTIDVFHSTLGNLVAGKSGMLRESLLPVFPNSIRAVVSPHDTADPLTIMVPRRAFNRIWKTSEDIRAVYGKKDALCILKGDPVHRECNLISVKFSLWDNDTIGVSPLLIQIMDRDYDGDEVTVSFVERFASQLDLKKLTLDFGKYFVGTKQLKDVDARLAYHALHAKVGKSSSSSSLYEHDQVKNHTLYEALRNGIDMKTAADEAVKAARDFTVVKEGTANGGAMNLRFIFSRNASDAWLLHDAMDLYHAVAQNTLDAKAGTAVPALDVIRGFSMAEPADEKLMRDALELLGYRQEKCIDALVCFAKKVKHAKGMRQYLSREFPVLATMQRFGSAAEVGRLAAKVFAGESLGNGVYETLFEFLTGTSNASPYDYVDVLSTLFAEHFQSGTQQGAAV
jgi:hypothetical protein